MFKILPNMKDNASTPYSRFIYINTLFFFQFSLSLSLFLSLSSCVCPCRLCLATGVDIETASEGECAVAMDTISDITVQAMDRRSKLNDLTVLSILLHLNTPTENLSEQYIYISSFSRRSYPERLTVSTGTFSPRQVG